MIGQKEFNEEMMSFIHDTTINGDSDKAFIEAGKKHCDKLLCDMQIGKLVYQIDATPNPTLQKGEKAEHIIYESNVELGEKYTIDYKLSMGGSISFVFYPVKGVEFSEQQKQQLNYMADVWYVTGGRVRVVKLCQNAISKDLQTGISNLDTFLKHMGKLIAMHQISNYNAYYINCKNFKHFNKKYGYSNGSAIIVEYARTLQAFCQGEEMVARLGGDNFVALINRERTEAFMGMLNGVSVTFMDKSTKNETVVSAIAGIFEIDDVKVPSEIMMPVSYSLQMARATHQDFVFFNRDVEKQIENSQKLLMDFETYLKNGEFVAYLQPKNNVHTGAICGAEALVRQIHQNVLVPPNLFIPVLERDGTICKLDFEILRQVCEQISKWCAQGIVPPRISVNFSRWNLQNDNFVKDIMDVISYYKVNPKYIEVELTETVDSEEYEKMVKIFEEIKKNGLTTSIDDFGSGYSSLKLIMNLDVDVLKIDKTLIQNMESHSKKKIVFSNIVRMAQEIGVEVLAEGVETEAQKEIIKSFGCNVAQGFLYNKPMPISEFEKLLMAK